MSGLLHPDPINNNLLHYDNKQIFFRNENMEKSLKIQYDVLIVGGQTNEGKFLNSHF